MKQREFNQAEITTSSVDPNSHFQAQQSIYSGQYQLVSDVGDQTNELINGMNFDQTLQEQCMSQFTEVEKPIKPHVDNRDSKSSASRRKNEGNH